MDSISFDKRASLSVKGFAILLMIAHHLFTGDPTSSLNYSHYYSFFHLLGVSGKLCVAMFMFVSGYGLHLSLAKNFHFTKSISRVRSAYAGYWKMFALIIPLLCIFGFIQLNFIELLLNAVCASSTYNGTWWFMQTYIIYILLFPILLKSLEMNKLAQLLWAATCILLFPYLAEVVRYKIPLGSEIHYILYYLGTFYAGMLFSKLNLFEKIERFAGKAKIAIFVFVIGASFLIRIYSSFHFGNLFIVISICGVSANLKNDLFVKLGTSSMNMWFVHNFFIDQRYFSMQMLEITKNPVIMYFLIVFLSYVVAQGISLFWFQIQKLIDRRLPNKPAAE